VWQYFCELKTKPSKDFIAKTELASTNQNPRIEWRREAPPLDSWVLCPKQNLLCYIGLRSAQNGITILTLAIINET
jgi:hypothetical protein